MNFELLLQKMIGASSKPVTENKSKNLESKDSSIPIKSKESDPALNGNAKSSKTLNDKVPVEIPSNIFETNEKDQKKSEKSLSEVNSDAKLKESKLENVDASKMVIDEKQEAAGKTLVLPIDKNPGANESDKAKKETKLVELGENSKDKKNEELQKIESNRTLDQYKSEVAKNPIKGGEMVNVSENIQNKYQDVSSSKDRQAEAKIVNESLDPLPKVENQKQAETIKEVLEAKSAPIIKGAKIIGTNKDTEPVDSNPKLGFDPINLEQKANPESVATKNINPEKKEKVEELKNKEPKSENVNLITGSLVKTDEAKSMKSTNNQAKEDSNQFNNEQDNTDMVDKAVDANLKSVDQYSRLVDVKTVDVKPVDAKQVDSNLNSSAKSVDANVISVDASSKSVDVKSTDTKLVDVILTDAKPVDAKPVNAKAKSIDTNEKSADASPKSILASPIASSNTRDVKPVIAKLGEIKPVDAIPELVDGNVKSADAISKSVDTKPADAKLVDAKTVDANAKLIDASAKSVDANSKSANARPIVDASSKSVDVKLEDAKPADTNKKSDDSNAKIANSNAKSADSNAKSTDVKPLDANPADAKTIDEKPVDTKPKSIDVSSESVNPKSVDVKSKLESDSVRDEQKPKDNGSKIPILVKKEKESAVVKVEAEKSANSKLEKCSLDAPLPKISNSSAKTDETNESENVVDKSNQFNFEVKVESKEIDIKSPAKEMMNYSNTWMREEQKHSSEISMKMYVETTIKNIFALFSPDFLSIFSVEETKRIEEFYEEKMFCHHCDDSLAGHRYVLRDDHPYCIKCYENVFANNCDECGKIIGIDSKVSYMHDLLELKKVSQVILLSSIWVLGSNYMQKKV